MYMSVIVITITYCIYTVLCISVMVSHTAPCSRPGSGAWCGGRPSDSPGDRVGNLGRVEVCVHHCDRLLKGETPERTMINSEPRWWQ